MWILALASEEITLWWVTLGIGVVVLAVVVALLQLLLNIVRRIDAGVAEVWATATRVAANTATAWQLGQTARHLERIAEEAGRHRELLEA